MGQDKQLQSRMRGNDYDHAIVIGSSIAGLSAARVLSDFFKRVTVVERDSQHEDPEFRKGVPQARHAHTLLPRGQAVLEQLYPGLVEELFSLGAIPVRPEKDIAFFKDGAWHTPRSRGSEINLASSRPMLEAAVYRRTASRQNVQFLNGYEVVGVIQDQSNRQATAVRLQSRENPTQEIKILTSNLIVDASGRNSQAPRWLSELGYLPPEEWHVNSFVGYVTRIYERPANFDGDWKTLYIRPTAPAGTRGGIILPMEGGRWQVTLIGVARDYPPTTEDGFLDYARSLPTPRLYEAIKDAAPLSKPSGYRRTDNRVRRYDRLPLYLEGFLVIGDAVYALNPIYAQGMTCAALGSLALQSSLNAQLSQPGLVGLAESFQKRLSKSVGSLWHGTVTKEWSWSVTELDDNTEQIYPADGAEEVEWRTSTISARNEGKRQYQYQPA